MKAQLTHYAYSKMMAFIDNCEDEISGLGRVEIKDGDFVVTDIEIFKQVVSPAHSDIDGASLAQFQVELLKKNENPKDWFCWWHSHAKMATFFSGTDMATINSSTDFPHMLSIVSNHKHEFSARFDLYKPYRLNSTVDIEVLEDENDEITKYCRAQIAAKVSTRQVIAPESKPFGFRHAHTHSEQKTIVLDDMFDAPIKNTNKDDEGVYKTMVDTMIGELREAYKAQNRKLIKTLQDDLYDLRMDGYYEGYENSMPIKR